ncbi:uncharacterized protein LOC124153751 [Ischnura elegans]|uniref:uncharacterized protein LOC124153751 n=1 Tax=Ischnura elegans TaxID=197161 RepID=UPI001ED899FD|nr:uncharacterized protein LOC124153751 [Ischnura elegans]
MGDEDQASQHQTRVLLVNGQTVILQGNPGDNAINEINADILQQALQEASAINDPPVPEETPVAYPTNDAPQPEQPAGDNLLAIFSGDQGETHTIRLTVEQAEALGLHFTVDGEENDLGGNDDNKTAISESSIANQQLSFDNPPQNVADGILLNNNVNAGKLTTTIQPPTLTTLQNCENVMPEPVVPSTNQSTMITGGVNPQISLIPHFVDGTMAYTVKIGETPGSLCQTNANLNFQEAVSEENSVSLANQLNSAPNIAPKCVTSLATTVIGSIPDIISSSTTQSIPLLEQNDPSLDQNKVSYIVLPTRNAGEMITTTAKLSEIGPNLAFSDNSENQRKVPSQVRIIPKTAIMSSLSIPSDGNRLTLSGNTQLTTVTTAAPISTAVVNTSLGTTSLDPIVSSTPTGSGMIRVVAKKDFPNNAQGSGVSATKLIPTKIKPLVEANGSTKLVPADGTQSAANSSVKLPLPNFNSEKPLGSSDNPIQLVQQGQTFHSMQPLSREQLKQIATVLQQRHFDTTKNSKNVLYDAETNTRIIYRVVYPEDCDLRDPRSPSDSPAVQASPSPALASVRGKSRRGRPPKSAMKPAPVKRVEPEEVPDIDVNKGDKDERKKQLPRTRSGRLSRPPRHMVKDYKRLHHLDFAEPDLDDSDGGYSDYQISEAEMEDEVRSTNEDMERNEALLAGLSTSKRKISSHFRCPTCQKVYLGHRRMARHFEMYPDHGSIEDLPKPSQPQAADPNKELPQETGVNDRGSATAENADGSRVAPPAAGEGESGTTPLSAPSATSTPQAPRTIIGGPNGIVRHGGPPYRRRGRRRGPHAYMTPEARSERRLAKLRELVGTCEPREVVEVAGSIVADSLTSWELLLLRAEGSHRTGTTSTAHIGTVCQELRSLLKEASNVVGPMLVPISTPESVPATTKLVDNEAKPKKPIRSHRLQIEDERIASMLGVKCGTYLVSESDDQKLLYRTPVRGNPLDESVTPKEEKDLEDLVSPEGEKNADMPPPSAEPAAKKMRLDEGDDTNKDGENSLLKSDISGSTGDEWSKEDSSRKDDLVDMLSGDMCESSEDREVTSLTLPSASVTSDEVVSATSPCVALSEVVDDVGEVSASGDHSSVQAVDELVSQHLKEMKIEKELDYTIDPKAVPVTSMSAVPDNCGGSVTSATIPPAFESLQDHFQTSGAGDTVQAEQMGVKCETQDSRTIPSESFSSTLGLSEVVSQQVDNSSKLQHGQCMDNVIPGDSVTKDLHTDHASSKVEINFQLPQDRSMNLDLTGSSIDMSLDSNIESGPELDFEALSEEFNRNTQS